MSFQAMAKAVEIKLPTQEKFVLIMLANYADESGKCWPSVQTLATNTGLSTATVKRALKKLIARGLLSREQRRKGNLKTSSLYSLNWG
jgi:DNA-binding MarR family transcriptional regulator